MRETRGIITSVSINFQCSKCFVDTNDNVDDDGCMLICLLPSNVLFLCLQLLLMTPGCFLMLHNVIN